MSTEKSFNLDSPLDRRIHRPVARTLARSLVTSGITPNQLTLLTLAPALFAAYCFYHAAFLYAWAGAACFYAWSVLDHADGELARIKSSTSSFGQKLDDAMDVVNSVVMLCGLFYGFVRLWNATDAALMRKIFWPGLFLNTAADILCLQARRSTCEGRAQLQNALNRLRGRDCFYFLIFLVISAYALPSWPWRSFVMAIFLGGLFVSSALALWGARVIRDNA
jgi:phosphatidylglycerophosphate synthase